ncbi:MAG: DUF87 domain-containing protein [Dehalococcoidia bacterium]|nr:DUF87 domain-containing protein [Dehalococcoidia bacterium]
MADVGELYLGQQLDLSTGEDSGEPLPYDRDDLTTHGVIVGMTGSGKTGLAVVLLEEALTSGIPALILDPKGDMPNLLLNFPDFAPSDFAPWVNDGDARNAGQSTGEFAAAQATMWRESSGITPERMRALTSSVEFSVYTPGSSAGTPLNIIGDLRAPSADTDIESIREEAAALVGGLLSLIDVDADPLASREHILLSNIVETAWAAQRDLDLAALIAQVLEPPFRKLGVFEVDTFFPAADRRALAMRLNGLVASPSFSAWTEGAPLDIGALLHTPDGRPRASIMYLAHLSDAERQFVVSLVLARVITWMRGQSGTNNLRALVYMDEVVGFVPPTAEPPAKRPILTILKQARAYGVGLVLATQNPVDLDYKAMSNAGTWMVGRLQTERDKARVLEALSSAAGSADLPAIDTAISGLGKREFVLHNTHDRGAPKRFSTRWAMSYLRGPLTRQQLPALPNLAAPPAAAPATPAGEAPASADASRAEPAEAKPALAEDESPVPPSVASGVPVYYVDPAAPWAPELGAVAGGKRLAPVIVARAHLRYDETRAGVVHREEWEAIIPLDGDVRLDQARQVDVDERDFRRDPPEGAVFVIPSAKLDTATFFRDVERDLKASLQRERTVELFANRELKLFSRVGETEEAFRARCEEAARAEADREAVKLRDTMESKMDRVRAALARAEDRVEQYQADTQTRSSQEWIAGAGALLGAFLGGKSSATSIAKRLGRSASGASSRRGQTTRTRQRLENAQEAFGRKAEELEDIEADLQDDLADLVERWEEVAAQVERLQVGLERDDVDVDEVALAWLPTK